MVTVLRDVKGQIGLVEKEEDEEEREFLSRREGNLQVFRNF